MCSYPSLHLNLISDVVLFEFMDNTTLLALPEAKEAWWWDFANAGTYVVCGVICTERELVVGPWKCMCN
jgi:hypothetical protein